MKWFLEATAYSYVHKNKQHTALAEMIKELDGILLHSGGGKDKIIRIIVKWSEKINRDYPRCKDVDLSGRTATYNYGSNNKEWTYIYWPGIGEVRFHAVKEEWR